MSSRLTSLSGQTALITGASSGIGAACARALATAGVRLILTARRTERLRELASALGPLGSPAVHTLRLDVRERDATLAALSALPPEWREVDILINNAGLGRGLDKLHQGSPAEWDEVIDTNVKGLLYVTRHVLPGMVERRRGHVVNLGSVASRQSYAGGNVYCATKAAVRMLGECLKQDLLGSPVRVTTIEPGMVETEFSVTRFRGDRDRADKVYQGMTPMTAEDIAETILFCLTRPAHVNISEIVMLATDQAAAATVFRRS